MVDYCPQNQTPEHSALYKAYRDFQVVSAQLDKEILESRLPAETLRAFTRQKAEWVKVQEAFYLDTIDRNSRDHAACVEDDFVKRCLANWEAELALD